MALLKAFLKGPSGAILDWKDACDVATEKE
jgi:hypothetical protein